MKSSIEPQNELKFKMKKNLVYVAIFAIVMFFAGLTSAYYVSMGGGFWLKYPLPEGFYFSTISIILSSVAYILGVRHIKQGKTTSFKVYMAATLLLGALFVVFQFRGYQQLVERGIYYPSLNWSYPEILVNQGRYGDTVSVYKDGKQITVDGNTFSCGTKPLTASEFSEFQAYMKNYALDQKSMLELRKKRLPAVSSNRFKVYFLNEPLSIKNGVFRKSDSLEFNNVDEIRLCQVANNVVNGRGQFMIRGDYGKDFVVYYKGEELSFKEGAFWSNGKKMSASAQLKAKETTDSSSAYLYVISFAHLLHILGALLNLLTVTIKSFRNRYSKENFVSVRLSSIFWHFLGLLWVYLLLFLNFIH